MSFIVIAALWVLGVVVTSFTAIPILVILRFSIPTTRTLERQGLLSADNGIVRRYVRRTVPLLLVALIGVTLLVFRSRR